MSSQSQRNVTVSAGDAAVLIRAMNRQRAGERAGRVDDEPQVRPYRGRGRRSEASRVRAVEPVAEAPGRSPRASRSSRLHRVERDRERGRGEERNRRDRQPRHSRAERAGKRRGVLSTIAASFVALGPRTRTALIVVCVTVLLGLFFYGPTADLYAAARDHEQLVQKVEATKAVAADLEDQVHRLQTEEGIMDEARIRGYANPGEVAVDASELLGIEDTVTVPELAKPIETEEPPLPIRLLDILMGYEERTS